MQKDVECRSDVTKWLSLGYSWPSVSTCGSKIFAFKLQKHFDTHCPGEDDYRPASFFPTGLVEPKCWYLKNGGVGWKHGGASLQVAHHNLTWHLHFPNNIGIGIVWEVEGNGEACFF